MKFGFLGAYVIPGKGDYYLTRINHCLEKVTAGEINTTNAIKVLP